MVGSMVLFVEMVMNAMDGRFNSLMLSNLQNDKRQIKYLKVRRGRNEN